MYVKVCRVMSINSRTEICSSWGKVGKIGVCVSVRPYLNSHTETCRSRGKVGGMGVSGSVGVK